MEFLNQKIISKTGYFVLEWESDEEVSIFISKDGEEPLQSYSGNLNKISYSGFKSGKYSFSLCPKSLKQPNPIDCNYNAISVDHYSFESTMLYTSIGFTLLLSIAGYIAYQFRKFFRSMN